MPHCMVCGAKAESEYCFRHKPRKKIRTKKDRGKYMDNYLAFFGYAPDERPICEVTGSPADQIHHMVARSLGGSDDPDNLIALVFPIHDCVERRHREMNDLLKIAHERFTATRKPLKVTDPALCTKILTYLTTSIASTAK